LVKPFAVKDDTHRDRAFSQTGAADTEPGIFSPTETSPNIAIAPVSSPAEIPVVGESITSACPYCGQAGCTGPCSSPCNCGCQKDRLCGFIAPSDSCFSNFISPQTNPLFFEDPRTLSEIRFHFVNHWIPDSQPLFQGGEGQFLAAQIRVALTERLSIIATKDGYIWLSPENDAIPNQDGWADVAAGLKYNVYRDPEAQRLLSVGTTFEFDSGTKRVFQGYGDGEFHVFASAGAELMPRAHWLSGTGFRLPTNDGERSQMWYWSNHWDYQLMEKLFAVVELNWFHWLKSGGRLPGVNFEGGDLFNLGSGDVAGNDIVTMGLGGRVKPTQNTELGLAYEFPLTERKDLLESRLYVDLILRY
jgi:hypothetical protein